MMKLSARNNVKIDIGGAVVTASITNETAEELELAAGLCRRCSIGPLRELAAFPGKVS
jgi:molybdopterin-binding protein